MSMTIMVLMNISQRGSVALLHTAERLGPYAEQALKPEKNLSAAAGHRPNEQQMAVLPPLTEAAITLRIAIVADARDGDARPLEAIEALILALFLRVLRDPGALLYRIGSISPPAGDVPSDTGELGRIPVDTAIGG